MMKYTVKYSTLFKKSYRKCMKRGCDEELFRTAITILAETGSLPKEYKPHPLRVITRDVWNVILPLIGF